MKLLSRKAKIISVLRQYNMSLSTPSTIANKRKIQGNQNTVTKSTIKNESVKVRQRTKKINGNKQI